MKTSPTRFHLSKHIHMQIEGWGKGFCCIWKVPQLNTPYNTINMELMTALRHAFSELILKVYLESVKMLSGNEIFLQGDRSLLWTF